MYLLIPPSLKGHINTLLELLVDELLLLGDTGIHIYDTYKKCYRQLFVYLLKSVCDLPARRPVCM